MFIFSIASISSSYAFNYNHGCRDYSDFLHVARESDVKITNIVSLSMTFDLAILKTDRTDKNSPYLTTKPNVDKKTQSLFILGYPQGKFSKVNQTNPLQIFSQQITFSMDDSKINGASGSPVLNNASQVVGVVSAYIDNTLLSIQSNQLTLD